MTQLLRDVQNGHKLTREEAVLLMESAPLEELTEAAGAMTRRFFGNAVDLCAIYPAKVGLCGGDCAFCAQSVFHSCDVTPVHTADLRDEDILAYARELMGYGVARLSLVTSGERLTNAEFERLLGLYGRLEREVGIHLCASLGALDADRAKRLRQAGVTRYHHNIETAPSYFPAVCTTHSYADKLETIRIARAAGLEVCSGGIISMGESPRQRVEMALTLRELDVQCVPVNILNPIPGTRLEKQPVLPVPEILRTLAVFRLVLGEKPLRLAGGREGALGGEEYRAYRAGANALIFGDYLTTRGKRCRQELRNLAAAGLTVAAGQ